MSKYDRFQGTPWDNLEHCSYCGLDYKLDKSNPHECEEIKEQSEEICLKCEDPILKGDGRFRFLGNEVYCESCGEHLLSKGAC